MTTNEYEVVSRSFYLRSKISGYPVSYSIVPVPEGLSVVLFVSEKDCQEFLDMRQISDRENFERVPIQSFYDSMREFAELGYIGVWVYKNFPVRFGNYYSDLDVDLPSFAYTFGGTFIGSSGLIDEPQYFVPWANYSRVDKIIRRFVQFPQGLYFDPRSPVYSIGLAVTGEYSISLVGGKEISVRLASFHNSSPLQGPYISDLGAYCLFTDADEAAQFIHQRTSGEHDHYEVIQFPSLLSAIRQIESDHPFIDISLNPTSPRHMQGYFPRVRDRLVLRMVLASFEIIDDGSWIKIEEPVELEKADTIDYPNEIDPTYRSLSSLIGHPLKRIRGATKSPMNRREARSLLGKLFEEGDHEQPIEETSAEDITAESYVLDCFDKINGESLRNVDETAPMIFSDVIAAILFAYNDPLPFDAKIRASGYHLCSSNINVSGSNDATREASILTELQNALRDLTEDILVSGYRIEHSELFRTFISRNSQSIEIRKCGYVGDLAVLTNNTAFALPDDAEKDELRNTAIGRLVKISSAFYQRRRDNPSLGARIQNRIRIHLGEAYEHISTASLLILESAVKEFTWVQDRLDHDYAGISMKLCKVFERELTSLVFEYASTAIKKHFDKDALKSALREAELRGDTNETKLLKWLLRMGKLELGPMAHIMQRVSEAPDTPILQKFRDSLAERSNCEFLMSSNFQDVCKQILHKFRNGGVHEKIITYDVCQEAFHCILEMKRNYLSLLAQIRPSKLPS